MKREEAITQVMHLSIENAEQWIKDGICLIENGSLVHGSVLLDFAGEEIAKAFVCWQVLIGAYPLEHPIVKPNKKTTIASLAEDFKKESRKIEERIRKGLRPGKNISIFSSHEVKDAVLIDLGSLMDRIRRFNLGQESQTEDSEKAQTVLNSLVSFLGKLGAWKREKWMYVDFETADTGFEVTAPQNEEMPDMDMKIMLHQTQVGFLKELVKKPRETFTEISETLRTEREKRDIFWPRRRKEKREE